MPCNPVSILNKTSFSAHTGNQLTTTIVTPSAAGEYRITAYAQSAAGFSGGTLALGWTDDNGAQTFSPGISGAYASASVVIHSAASQAITFELLPGGSITWDAFVTVEDLNT